jgi:hypothetical protein
MSERADADIGALYMAQQKTANRNRFDFSKIPATIQIPNLI